LRKVSFLEKKLGRAKYKLFITYIFDSNIRDETIRLLTNAGVDIILVSRHRLIKTRKAQNDENY